MDKQQEKIRGENLEKKSVLLTVTGIQTDSGGNSMETRAEYRAVYSADSAGHFFQYSAEGEEASLFLSSEVVRMERGKERKTRMIFDPSVPATNCSYVTPFGTIPIEIRTKRIAVMDGRRGAGSNQRIRVSGRVKYILGMGEDEVIDCTVTIKAQQIE